MVKELNLSPISMEALAVALEEASAEASVAASVAVLAPTTHTSQVTKKITKVCRVVLDLQAAGLFKAAVIHGDLISNYRRYLIRWPWVA